jgi:hypothetical protein
MLKNLLQHHADPAPCTPEDFGPPLATFEDTARDDISLTIGEALRLGGVLLLMGMIVIGSYTLLAGTLDWGVVVLTLSLGVITLPLTYTLLIMTTPGSTTTVRRATVHECGLALWRGGELRNVPWDTVVQFYEASTLHMAGKRILGTTVSARLIVDSGGDTPNPQFDLRASITGIADLVALLREQLVPLLDDRALAAVQRGEAVDFGHWRVNESRVADVSKNRTLPWGDITTIQVEGGMIRLLKWPQEVWSETPVAQMPNARTFVAVAERCTGRPATLGKHAWIAVQGTEE